MVVPCAAEADIVGEDGGAPDIVVSVHGVNAVDLRNAQTRRESTLLERVRHVNPLRHSCLVSGSTTSAAHDATCKPKDAIPRIKMDNQ